MTEYTITVDRDACDGIFACLVRDDRFVEADDGTVTVDSDADGLVKHRSDGRSVNATFEGDGNLTDAQQAAAACPVDAITVEES